MIDLHCHILPSLDDGAVDLETALAMARAATADGITHITCTPHIFPGLYDNTAAGIEVAVSRLRRELHDKGIALELSGGADIHLVPTLLDGLHNGVLPTLNHSRYLLLEPPHRVAPPRLAESVFALVAHGFVPLITHPERLHWIDHHYITLCNLANHGAWLQVTAASLSGGFGRRARYWAERLLDEGWVHVLATDAHGIDHRPPVMSDAFVMAEKRLGMEEAQRLVTGRPRAVWENASATAAVPPPALRYAGGKNETRTWRERLCRRRR